MAHSPGGQGNSNPFQQQAAIPGVKRIIAVSSGKGGVGKSTVAVNLAASLATKYKVGILDADIYGPSLPRMMGALNQKPLIRPDQKIEPIVRYGMKLMSMGFIIDENAAVVWRGPMLFKAMEQFLRDVVWGELDYLIVDLPPGTGDIQLSLAQKVPITAAIVVSTPQNLALTDVKKAIDMWNRVAVPIIGIVENMAWLTLPNGERMQLFPNGDLNKFLFDSKLTKIAEIPFDPAVGLSGEAGIPISQSYPDSVENAAFQKLADSIASYQNEASP